MCESPWLLSVHIARLFDWPANVLVVQIGRWIKTTCLTLCTSPLCQQNSSDPLRHGQGTFASDSWCLSGARMLPVGPLGPLGCGVGPPRIGLVLEHHTYGWSDWDPGSLQASSVPCALYCFPQALLGKAVSTGEFLELVPNNVQVATLCQGNIHKNKVLL